MKKITLILFAIFSTISFAFGQKIDSIDCSGVRKTTDEFTGYMDFKVRITDEVYFLKIKNGGVSTYYLSIWIKVLGFYHGQGVRIILKNGERIYKPNEEVVANYSASDFYVTAFIRLTTADIALLKQSGIEKYKLSFSTGDISDYSDLSKDLFNCIVKAK